MRSSAQHGRVVNPVRVGPVTNDGHLDLIGTPGGQRDGLGGRMGARGHRRAHPRRAGRPQGKAWRSADRPSTGFWPSGSPLCEPAARPTRRFADALNTERVPTLRGAAAWRVSSVQATTSAARRPPAAPTCPWSLVDVAPRPSRGRSGRFCGPATGSGEPSMPGSAQRPADRLPGPEARRRRRFAAAAAAWRVATSQTSQQPATRAPNLVPHHSALARGRSQRSPVPPR